jgi:hypothetical protein
MMPVPTHNPQRLSGAVGDIRAQVNGAVAIIRDAIAAARRRDRSVRAKADVQKIEEEIRAYVKNPRTTINRRFFLSPDPPPGPAQKRLAKRLVKQLQELSNLLDDDDLPEWLDWRDTGRWAKAIAEDLGSNWAPDECSVRIEHWIREANVIASWKSSKKGKAEARSDAAAKLAAAERAVRLFKHHGLKLYRSHSRNNKLNQLAAAIHGTRLVETDKGFFQHCCTVISALANRPE